MSMEGKQGRHLVLGILAHVDAGKTTLSECLLFQSGKIRKLGRVDHQDAYLDTDKMERARGITIFSKQAELAFGDLGITLMDTPGHVDFSPEMERVLAVLDYAILVISAPDGITAQVSTLWRLLEHYQVPAFLFVNKMDQPGQEREKILAELKEGLSDACVDFGMDEGALRDNDAFREEIAVTDEAMLERYLESGQGASVEEIRTLVRKRKIFPVCFGSALRNEGVDRLAELVQIYAENPSYGEEFGARVFKITHDASGQRLSHVKVTGGSMRTKMVLADGRKIDQIRIYSGDGFTPAGEVEAGRIAVVTGLEGTRAGQGLGFEDSREEHLLQPVFTRKILLEDGQDISQAVRNLRQLEEEEPLLNIGYDEQSQEITASIMGEVETEILRNLCQERFDMKISFGPESIVYKETIARPVEGVGHYEPLRHYSEVHLMMTPGSPGSGLTFEADCPLDLLARNWQRLIMTHLTEKKHKGVLTGAEITDMKITLIAGRAHEKHTEGGDFRQATYRAIRQGLMMAESILLEPIYSFTADIPQENIGRFLTDIQRMEGSTETPEGDGVRAQIKGTVPAAEAGEYPAVLRAYSHGEGEISFALKGYEPARHPEEIILEKGYQAESDLENSPDSVFCSHGAGVIVPWDQVRNYMHIDTGWRPEDQDDLEVTDEDSWGDAEAFASSWQQEKKAKKLTFQEEERNRMAGEDELQSIFERTYGGSSWRTPIRSEQNQQPEGQGIWSKDGSLEREEEERKAAAREALKKTAAGKPGVDRKSADNKPAAGGLGKKNAKTAPREDYLLVDGYNIIFAWDELRDLAAHSIDAARDKLIDILADYQGSRTGHLILVFDAYRVHGGRGQVYRMHNIDVVYTKEAETADTYIVETAHSLSNKGSVTVATSDGIVQMIIFGQGAIRMSARDLEADVKRSRDSLRQDYLK